MGCRLFMLSFQVLTCPVTRSSSIIGLLNMRIAPEQSPSPSAQWAMFCCRWVPLWADLLSPSSPASHLSSHQSAEFPRQTTNTGAVVSLLCPFNPVCPFPSERSFRTQNVISDGSKNFIKQSTNTMCEDNKDNWDLRNYMWLSVFPNNLVNQTQCSIRMKKRMVILKKL